MAEPPRPARDLQLLDTVDAFRREPLDAEVWRVVRDSRDPVLGSPSLSRWCNGTFDVLYTSFERRDGAVAEIHSLLSLQPVFPSRTRWYCPQAEGFMPANPKAGGSSRRSRRLGVDDGSLRGRDYARTQPDAPTPPTFLASTRSDRAKCALALPQSRSVLPTASLRNALLSRAATNSRSTGSNGAAGPGANVRKPSRAARLDGFANPASPSSLARTDMDEAADRRKR